MLTSVIIPAHNEAHNIQQCIAAARRDYVASQVEVIVVDGASTDGTPDLVPRDVTLLRAPRGRAKAMNRGAHASQGQILVFCRGDSQLPAGWCSAVIEALNQPGVSGGAFQSRFEPQVGLLRLGNTYACRPSGHSSWATRPSSRPGPPMSVWAGFPTSR